MSEDLDRAAVALAAVSVTDRTAALRGPDLDAAGAARDSTLLSAQRLLARVAPQSDRWGRFPDTLAEIQRRPARVLQRLLIHQPLIGGDGSLSDALAHPASTPAVGQWQTAARYLFLAENAWSTAHAPAVPPPAAWGVTAAVAGTALALDRLDTQLAAAYHADGHPDVADRLTAARHTGLPVAAREALATAATGPLDTTWTPLAEPGHVHPVRGIGDLAAGAHRYRDLVTRAPTLSPAAIFELAQGQRIVLAHAARLLRPAEPQVAAAIDEHTRDLAAVPGFRRIATILPSDPRPGLQLSQLVQQIRRLQSHQLTDPAVRDAVHTAAARVAATIPALAGVAARQQKLGQWLVPRERSTNPWRPVGTLDQLPTVDALHASRPSAGRAVTALTTPATTTREEIGGSRAVDALTAAAAHARHPPRGATPDHATPAGAGGVKWADNAANTALRWHRSTTAPTTESRTTGDPRQPVPSTRQPRQIR